jgi:hypothetical protein
MPTLPNVGDKNQFSDQGEKKNLRPKIGIELFRYNL